MACGHAVAAETRGTVGAILDGDTLSVELDGERTRVRLLYVDAPTAADNPATAPLVAGGGAAEALGRLLPLGSEVVLWSAADTFAEDDAGRLLAVVTCRSPLGRPEIVQEVLVRAGWSPYAKRHGPAPDPLHAILTGAHESARLRRVGLWRAHRAWMDGAAIPAAERQVAAGDEPAAAKAGHWLNTGSGTRHNPECRWFENTKNGRPCGPDEGQACRECGG